MIADAKAEGRAEWKAEGVLEILVKPVRNGTLAPTSAAENAGTIVDKFIVKTGLNA